MTPRRLILHVGYFKTGSTALQNHLAFHADGLLRSNEILYPRSARPALGKKNHGGLPLQILYDAGHPVPPWYMLTRPFRQYVAGESESAWESIVAEVGGEPASIVIISSEEFTRFCTRLDPSTMQRFVHELGFETTTIVCYLRRPDRYLEAWYNQLVKIGTPQGRLSEEIDEYLATEHTNFDWAVSYWQDVVDGGELILRDYDRLIDGSIVTDFADATKLDIPGEVPPDQEPNLRLDDNFVEYVRRLMLLHDGTPRPRLRRLLHDMARDPDLPPRRPVSVLDRSARSKLYEHSVEMNQRLGQLAGLAGGFFADLDDMLDVPDDSLSDIEAFEFWAPHLDAAIREAERGRA